MEESENDATDTVAVTACSVGSATPSLDSLPEHLILHILSFLPTQDTISTSLVSKKLRSYWSLIPSLNLSYSRFPPYNTPSTTRQFFAEFVDRTLISRSLSPLLKFCLDFIYEDRYGFHVDSWIRYAIKNQLELLTGYTQYDLLGMAQLLELTPHMETLILDYLLKVDKDESLSEELLKKPINLSIPSLKEVKMKQFTCTEKEDSLWRALEIHFDCSLPRHSQFIHFFSTLRSIHFGSQVSIIWRVAVVTCIWEIWHCRNEAIFKDVSPSIQHSKINLFRMIRESFASSKGFCSSRRDAVILSCLLASPRPPLAPNIIPVHWLKPPPGWIKVNVDGSAFGTPGEAGAGGIFRNYRGFPNGCFAFSTPLSFAYMAELRAAIFAIELAWETNWHQLWVESDSIYVVNLLRHRSIDVPWSIRQEWLHCLSICSRMNILVSHIFREGNRVADALVKVWSLFFSNQLVAFRSYFFATGLSMMTFVIFLNCVFLDFSEPFSSPSFVCSPPSHLVQTLTFFFY
ncbi:uncharacterized protein [Euphorbia lathyris]|uniref:uncharacterized protein isoform X4 n=1 Tax=Euphorbia lathyris TaxID=212925 RepID=UPI003313E520